MFSLNGFALKTVKGMIGNYPDFQAMEYALDWYGKGVLTESNLAEIESMIEIKNTPDEVIEAPVNDVGGLDPAVTEEPAASEPVPVEPEPAAEPANGTEEKIVEG